MPQLSKPLSLTKLNCKIWIELNYKNFGRIRKIEYSTEVRSQSTEARGRSRWGQDLIFFKIKRNWISFPSIVSSSSKNAWIGILRVWEGHQIDNS